MPWRSLSGKRGSAIRGPSGKGKGPGRSREVPGFHYICFARSVGATERHQRGPARGRSPDGNFESGAGCPPTTGCRPSALSRGESQPSQRPLSKETPSPLGGTADLLAATSHVPRDGCGPPPASPADPPYAWRCPSPGPENTVVPRTGAAVRRGEGADPSCDSRPGPAGSAEAWPRGLSSSGVVHAVSSSG